MADPLTTAPASPTPEADYAKPILDQFQGDPTIKHDAWDAFHQSASSEDFQTRFQKLNLPDDVKHDLWNAKFAQPTGMTQPRGQSAQLKGDEVPPPPPNNWLTDPLVGVAKNLGSHLLNADNAIRTGLNKAGAHYPELSASDFSDNKNLLTPTNTAQKVGAGGEDVAEFLAPESKLAEAGKAIDAARAVPAIFRFGAKAGMRGVASAGISSLQGGTPGEVAATGALGAAGEALAPAVKYAATKLPSSSINRLIGVTRKSLAYGNDPGKAILDEGLNAGSVEGLRDAVANRIDALKQHLSSALSSPRATLQNIDAGQHVIQPIDDALDAARNGPISDKGKFQVLKDLRDSITHGLDVDGARGNPKNLVMPPSNAVDLKRAIGKATVWSPENAPYYDELTALKRRIYGNLDKAVDAAVPGTEKINSRMSNMISALEALERKVPQVERSASFLSRIGLPAMGAFSGALHGGVEGAVVGAGMGMLSNAAKDAAASTPGRIATAQALRHGAEPASMFAGAASKAIATHVNPLTGQQIYHDGQNWLDSKTGQVIQ